MFELNTRGRRLAGTMTVWLAMLSAARAEQASTPASPSLPPVEAGFGKGVTIRSTDDDVSLNIRARIQVRSTVLDDPDDDQEALSEILIRRMRLVFQGNALGSTLSYYVQLSFANLDMEPDLRLPLRDAYVTWVPSRDLNVRVGQMKVPFSRQRVISSSALQMVDRSIVVAELNLDRDVGVQVFSKDLLGVGKLGYSAGVFGGEGRNRLGRALGYLYAARLEMWPLGPFDDGVEGDIRRTPKLGVALGASVGYNQNTNRPRSTFGLPLPVGDFDYTHAGLDVVVKRSGWSLTSEVMYRRADTDTRMFVEDGVPTTVASRSGWGWYVQAGRMVSSRTEVAARYSHLVPATGTDATLVKADEAGLGINYYIREHNLKVQGDYFSVTNVATTRRAHQARVQLQLFF